MPKFTFDLVLQSSLTIEADSEPVARDRLREKLDAVEIRVGSGADAIEGEASLDGERVPYAVLIDGEDRQWGKLFAEIHSDDLHMQARFSPALWLEQAAEDEILSLARCGWRGDYPADHVAEFMSEGLPRVAAVLAYVADTDDCGFEVSVDRSDALDWLERHRPEVAAKVRQVEDETGL